MLTITGKTSFEKHFRYRKVVALLRALENLSAGVLTDAELADSVPLLPPAIRKLIAAKANVRTPSETTWAVVASFFAERARRA